MFPSDLWRLPVDPVLPPVKEGHGCAYGDHRHDHDYHVDLRLPRAEEPVEEVRELQYDAELQNAPYDDVYGTFLRIPFRYGYEGPREGYHRGDPVQQEQLLVPQDQEVGVLVHYPLDPLGDPHPLHDIVQREYPHQFRQDGNGYQFGAEELRMPVLLTPHEGQDDEQLRKGGQEERVQKEYQENAQQDPGLPPGPEQVVDEVADAHGSFLLPDEHEVLADDVVQDRLHDGGDDLRQEPVGTEERLVEAEVVQEGEQHRGQDGRADPPAHEGEELPPDSLGIGGLAVEHPELVADEPEQDPDDDRDDVAPEGRDAEVHEQGVRPPGHDDVENAEDEVTYDLGILPVDEGVVGIVYLSHCLFDTMDNVKRFWVGGPPFLR